MDDSRLATDAQPETPPVGERRGVVVGILLVVLAALVAYFCARALGG